MAKKFNKILKISEKIANKIGKILDLKDLAISVLDIVQDAFMESKVVFSKVAKAIINAINLLPRQL